MGQGGKHRNNLSILQILVLKVGRTLSPRPPAFVNWIGDVVVYSKRDHPTSSRPPLLVSHWIVLEVGFFLLEMHGEWEKAEKQRKIHKPFTDPDV